MGPYPTTVGNNFLDTVILDIKFKTSAVNEEETADNHLFTFSFIPQLLFLFFHFLSGRRISGHNGVHVYGTLRGHVAYGTLLSRTQQVWINWFRGFGSWNKALEITLTIKFLIFPDKILFCYMKRWNGGSRQALSWKRRHLESFCLIKNSNPQKNQFAKRK